MNELEYTTGEWLVNTQPSQEELDAIDECHRQQDPNGLLL
jgi:hypothetical protein